MGLDLKIMDNFYSGKRDNLEKIDEDIQFIGGDVREKELIEKLFEDIDIVFHLAANASVPNSVENPSYDFETNCKGTFNICEACRKHGIDKLVYASTAAVYGNPQYIPIDESHPLNPISPYGASKLSGEKIISAFSETYGIPSVSLRIFNVYGPGQRKYVMYDFLNKLHENPSILEVLGSGEQKRTFCFIEDAINGFLLATKKGEGVYNLAGNEVIKISELARLFVDKIAPEAEIVYTQESWEGDIKSLVGDISKIEELGFSSRTSLEEGIENLIDWYKSEVKV